jgi:hypothetical protein
LGAGEAAEEEDGVGSVGLRGSGIVVGYAGVREGGRSIGACFWCFGEANVPAARTSLIILLVDGVAGVAGVGCCGCVCGVAAEAEAGTDVGAGAFFFAV